MLRIRLRRTGAKKKPSYRLVVADARAPRDGAFIEILGYYNPLTEPSTVVIDAVRAQKWLAQGAQPSDRVARLLKREGITAGGDGAAAQATAVAEPAAEEKAPARSTRRSAAKPTEAAAATASATEAPPAEAEGPTTAEAATRSQAADAETKPTGGPAAADTAPASEP
jgi:small subunit ribosomal protein S16